MSEYIRPQIIASDDLAEGVFAASGSTSGGTAYSLTKSAEWDGNKIYSITFTNNSAEKVPSVTAVVQVNGDVTSIGGNVSGSINGNTASLTFTNWGNGIEANSTVVCDYVLVQGNGDFGIQ